MTTSLTVETGTVRGEGVGGGERGSALEAGAGGCKEDGGAEGAVVLNGAVAGSVLLEGKQETLSDFRPSNKGAS